jgi:HEPN domain-containing protein
MDEAKRQLVQNWLIKAQHDLATARKLAADPEPYLDTAIYHCQQAAEKALKGFLVFHDQEFEKSHHLPLLVTQAASFDAQFATRLDAAELLTPYATAFRYPGEVMEPDREEFGHALHAAEELDALVLSLLPKEVYP